MGAYEIFTVLTDEKNRICREFGRVLEKFNADRTVTNSFGTMAGAQRELNIHKREIDTN